MYCTAINLFPVCVGVCVSMRVCAHVHVHMCVCCSPFLISVFSQLVIKKRTIKSKKKHKKQVLKQRTPARGKFEL